MKIALLPQHKPEFGENDERRVCSLYWGPQGRAGYSDGGIGSGLFGISSEQDLAVRVQVQKEQKEVAGRHASFQGPSRSVPKCSSSRARLLPSRFGQVSSSLCSSDDNRTSLRASSEGDVNGLCKVLSYLNRKQAVQR